VSEAGTTGCRRFGQTGAAARDGSAGHSGSSVPQRPAPVRGLV
jgi:hypothetical protein